MISEQLIRGADNQIKLVLTEDGVPISGAWTGLDIHIGDVVITRTADGDGVTLSTSTGMLIINPADLTAPEVAALDALNKNRSYKVQIVVTSVLNDDGAVFGGNGSDGIYFFISDKPE